MTVFKHVQSAMGVPTEVRWAWRARPRLPVVLMLALLMAATSGFPISARANGNPAGSAGVGSSSRMVSAPSSGSGRIGSLHARDSSLHRFRVRPEDIEAFRRGIRHHGERDDFGAGFFPLGWPLAEPDLATADESDGMGWVPPRFWMPVERYQPPTVEKTPSGVTIIRGPGSSHRVWP